MTVKLTVAVLSPTGAAFSFLSAAPRFASKPAPSAGALSWSTRKALGLQGQDRGAFASSTVYSPIGVVVSRRCGLRATQVLQELAPRWRAVDVDCLHILRRETPRRSGFDLREQDIPSDNKIKSRQIDGRR